MSCPLCGGPSRPRLRAPDINRRLSDDRYPYDACDRCGSLFLTEIPADLGRFYPAEYYDPADIAVPTEQAKLAIVRRHATSGRLIEIGPGRGGFAQQAVAAGFEVAAIEMDGEACASLRARLGIDVVQSDDPARALGELAPADVICLWHVIEHLREPWPLLEAAAARLAPGGVLVIATPNPGALGLRLLRTRWTHLDAPRHLRLIAAPLLAERAAHHGLAEVERVLDDRTARDWNAYGWQQALRRLPQSAKLGSAVALALAPLERRGTRPSAYTSVFRDTRPR